MGCDITCYAEKQQPDGTWQTVARVLDWRSYGMYGFLGNVRNYSAVPFLSFHRGLPENCSVLPEYERYGEHFGASWLDVQELLNFDYDATFEDRRYTKQIGPGCWDGGSTCEPGNGVEITFREFLGMGFFEELGRLVELGADRIVFWFD